MNVGSGVLATLRYVDEQKHPKAGVDAFVMGLEVEAPRLGAPKEKS